MKTHCMTRVSQSHILSLITGGGTGSFSPSSYLYKDEGFARIQDMETVITMGVYFSINIFVFNDKIGSHLIKNNKIIRLVVEIDHPLQG